MAAFVCENSPQLSIGTQDCDAEWQADITSHIPCYKCGARGIYWEDDYMERKYLFESVDDYLKHFHSEQT